MTATTLRQFLPAMLLAFMPGMGVALDGPTQCFPIADRLMGTNCDMRNYDIQMIVNEVKMRDATLDEAVACIREAVTKAKGETYNHVNFVILGNAPDPARRASLDLKQVTLKLAVEEVARTFRLQMRTETYAVVLSPASYPQPIHTRTYRVPADFISKGSAAK